MAQPHVSALAPKLFAAAAPALLHAALGARFSDAQCGFKAIRADRARELLPLVQDRGWFFDTELLVLGFTTSSPAARASAAAKARAVRSRSVAAHFTARTIGGVAVYDLTAPKA